MSKMEIAKAYVQIIPSTDGIESKLKEELGEASGNAGKSSGDIFGQLFSGSVIAMAAKLGADLASKMGQTIKQSLSEYSNYEQLIGGTEILFKRSSKVVSDYADNAYKTSGLSANDYLSTVNMFAASLTSSLHGDTKKAAELANTAIVDMSDNVNTFGTDMESVQNAYKGFAKNYYAMLDNLNLGFSGTTEGMEQLLNKARAISGVKYDINNLSDVIEAIHVVQTQMGITGKTAEEASKTMEGSLNSMKAAWKNLLSGMADGTKDINALVRNVGESGQNVIANFVPRVKTTIEQLGQAIASIAVYLKQNHQMLADAAAQIIATIVGTIHTNADALAQVGEELIAILVESLIRAIPKLKEYAPNIVKGLADSLSDPTGARKLGEAGGKIISNLIDSLINKQPKVNQTGENITKELGKTMSNNKNTFSLVGTDWVNTLRTSFENSWVVMKIRSVPEWVTSLKTAFSIRYYEFREIGTNIHANIKKAIDEAWSGRSGVKEQAKTWMANLKDSFVEAIKEFATIGNTITATIKASISNTWNSWLSSWTDSPEKLMKDLKNKFMDQLTSWKDIGSNIVQGIKEGIRNAWETMKNEVTEKAKQLVNQVKEVLGIHSPSKVFAQEVGKWIPAGIAQGITQNMGVVNSAIDKMAYNSVQDSINGTRIQLDHAYSTTDGATISNAGYNQTINVYSPTELNPSEIARQTKNATRNMVLALRGV